jgi:hypothetical protein
MDSYFLNPAMPNTTKHKSMYYQTQKQQWENKYTWYSIYNMKKPIIFSLFDALL